MNLEYFCLRYAEARGSEDAVGIILVTYLVNQSLGLVNKREIF